MGSGTSRPLPDLPTNNYFCITFTMWDHITVLYGSKYFDFLIYLYWTNDWNQHTYSLRSAAPKTGFLSVQWEQQFMSW